MANNHKNFIRLSKRLALGLSFMLTSAGFITATGGGGGPRPLTPTAPGNFQKNQTSRPGKDFAKKSTVPQKRGFIDEVNEILSNALKDKEKKVITKKPLYKTVGTQTQSKDLKLVEKKENQTSPTATLLRSQKKTPVASLVKKAPVSNESSIIKSITSGLDRGVNSIYSWVGNWRKDFENIKNVVGARLKVINKDSDNFKTKAASLLSSVMVLSPPLGAYFAPNPALGALYAAGVFGATEIARGFMMGKDKTTSASVYSVIKDLFVEKTEADPANIKDADKKNQEEYFKKTFSKISNLTLVPLTLLSYYFLNTSWNAATNVGASLVLGSIATSTLLMYAIPYISIADTFVRVFGNSFITNENDKKVK